MNQPLVTVVCSCFNHQNFLEDALYSVLQQTYPNVQIIVIDDASTDNSWEVMKLISSKNNDVKSIRLSRNFGQHPAIMAGLSEAKGEWIVVMWLTY